MGVHRKITHNDLPTQMTCSVCGAVYELGMYRCRPEIHNIMQSHSICFTCAFWKKILNKEVDYAIVDGQCYLVNQEPKKVQLTTNARSDCKYLMNENFHTRCLGSVQLYGAVPQHLRPFLPDEGIFVSRKIYYKGLSGYWKCNRKGCWDRYHCLRYDLNIEKDGPWNTVPENHIIGDEDCYSFIDKKIFGL